MCICLPGFIGDGVNCTGQLCLQCHASRCCGDSCALMLHNAIMCMLYFQKLMNVNQVLVTLLPCVSTLWETFYVLVEKALKVTG